MRAVLRALSNLFRLLLAPLWLLGRVFGRPKSPWLELRLSSRLRELTSATPLWQRVLRQGRKLQPTSLEDLRVAAKATCADPRVTGWLVHLPALHAGWAVCASLRDVLLSVRAAGKQVVCYLPEGGGSRELYVALAADRIWLAPPASFAPLGVASRPIFLRSLLDRLGIAVQVQATGEYKSAAEPLLRDSMSPAAREQSGALLGTMHEALRGALAQRPSFDAEKLERVLSRGLMTARAAHELGVIDGLAYEDELRDKLGLSHAKQPLLPVARHARFHRSRLLVPVRAEPYIAIVSVRGTIVGDEPSFGRSGAALGTVVSALRTAAADPRARAVVVYINSPGGSAHASDLIHREVQKLSERKPVIACMGDVAASGGYYIAAAARRIVAQPVTVTGSIGVISLKVSIDGVLARLGVHTDALQTTAHADMFSITRKLSEDEERIMHEHARELYGRFLEVVARGRGKTTEEIDTLARGRVWSGRDAHARGLVDVLGGFEVALDEARKLVTDLGPDQRAALAPKLVVLRDEPLPPIGPAPEAAPAEWLRGVLPSDATSLLWLLRREALLYYAPVVTK